MGGMASNKTVLPFIPCVFVAQLFLSGIAAAGQIDIVGPAGSGQFGTTVTALPNGNFVVTDPIYDAPGPIAAVGRVYLYNGKTLALINTMTGTVANDLVGRGGVTVLANGDYVVVSPDWNNSIGAVTRCSATSGCPATISAANSLVGSAGTPGVGQAAQALPNGNYVVLSWNWNNQVGAVTWCSGASSCVGAVSTANSLVGSTSGDMVGAYSIIVLTNGNYVVQSVAWSNGAATYAGAATRCSGTAACTGTVSPANSLVGSTSSDLIGEYGIIPLTNGGYVVNSPRWANGAIVNAGAVTFCNAASGCTGTVSATNSLIGSTANDQIGLTTVVLNNGNYVVASPNWDNGPLVDAGAATFGNGTTGRVGTITSANSLVGMTAYEGVGNNIIALTNGNYVVSSPFWDNPVGPINNAGAATWCSGTSGCTGAVTAANSMTGPSNDDSVVALKALANGNYLVGNPYWDNHAPFAADAGAVAFCGSASGCVGTVTNANSLVGSTGGDHVGNDNIIALSNGNYVVLASSWSNGPTARVGAATFCSGTTGCSGTISPGNSLVGSTAGDQIGGGGVALAGGNYVVLSPSWKNGAITMAGAITHGGASGITGPVTSANSLVGSTNGDTVGGGSGQTIVLPNGDYIASSTEWDNAGIANAGAITTGYQNGSTVGPITAANSVRGGTMDGGLTLNYSYDSTNNQIVVGRPNENIVTVFGQSVGGSPISLKITSIARLASGHIVLQGNGVASAVHTVERSLTTPASSNFGSLTTTTASGSGVIQFEDSTSTGLTKGFYRLAYP